jgi:hypothetical protein
MKATELIKELQKLVAEHGDHPVIIHHTFVESINYSETNLLYHDNTLKELYTKSDDRENIYDTQFIIE